MLKALSLLTSCSLQQERKIVDMPWHERNGEGTEKEVPYYPGLPTKRTPIKGMVHFSG